MSSAIECVFQSSRISVYSSTSTGRRSSSRIRSEAMRRFLSAAHARCGAAGAATAGAAAAPGRSSRFRGRSALQLPHALARIAAVALHRDRPQGLSRLDDVCSAVAGLRPCPAPARPTRPLPRASRRRCDRTYVRSMSEHVFDVKVGAENRVLNEERSPGQVRLGCELHCHLHRAARPSGRPHGDVRGPQSSDLRLRGSEGESR